MKDFISQFSLKNYNIVNEDLVVNLRKKDSIEKYLDEMFKEIQRIEMGVKYLGYYIKTYNTDNINNLKVKKNNLKIKTTEIDRSLFETFVFNFELRFKGEKRNLSLNLNLPKMYDDYYYLLKGNKYSTPYQLIDSLTYSNRKDSIVVKTMIKKLRLHRKQKIIKDVFNDKFIVHEFYVFIFKNIPILLYYFAKMGFYTTIRYFCKDSVIGFTENKPLIKDVNYIFFKFGNFYIRVERDFFNKNEEIKNFIGSLLSLSKRDRTLESVKSVNYWKLRLGSYISNTDSFNKGESIINTFDTSLDSRTIQNIYNLTGRKINSTYALIRWCFINFRTLILKKNNMQNIRLRLSEYLISPIQKALLKNIYRFLNTSDNINDINKLVDVFKIHPDIIINAIIGKSKNKDQKIDIIQFNGSPNDLSILNALKFTFGGPGSSSGTKSRSISSRSFDIYAVGKLCIIAATANNPGMTGLLALGAKIDNDTMTFKDDEKLY